MLFLGISQSNAQNAPPAGVVFLQTVQACGLKEVVHSNIQNDYEELPLAIGEGQIRHVSGGVIDVKMHLYVNPDLQTFTFVADIIKDNKACIMLTGENFMPAPRGSSL
jgi:hypothetical protein